MNHVVEAALIGVGGSVIVATVAFLTSYFTTRNQLADARQARLWDKRSAAYEDAIAGVRYQQELRKHQVAGNKVPPELGDPPVGWAELQGRVFAYGSPAVLRAVRAGAQAGQEVDRCYAQWRAVKEQVAKIGATRPEQVPGFSEARQAVIEAVKAADAKDNSLIDAIRADLHDTHDKAMLDLLTPMPANSTEQSQQP